MQQRKKETILLITCPDCGNAVAACRESAKDTKPEPLQASDPEQYTPQSFNEQARSYVSRGYKTAKVTEGTALVVCRCKKQKQAT